MNETAEQLDINDYVASLGLTYTAHFVPWKQSRNAENDPCLNWHIIITDGKTTLSTDYMQGIGFLPGFNHSDRTVWYRGQYVEACQTRKWAGKQGRLPRKVAEPSLTDVLYALVMDAGALDYACFEDWASDSDYDPDSRKAKKTYRACMDIALKLQHLINIAEAQEAFQDY